MQVHSRPDTGRAEPPPDASRATAMLREILFASDLSRASDVAFEHASHLAEAFRAHLTVFHALEVDPKPRGGPRDPRLEYWRRRERQAREMLQRAIGPPSPRIDLVVEQTVSASRALLARVDALRPDLTVMATHGREGLAHLVMGSLTETVLHGSGTTLLCVREPVHGRFLDYRRVLVPTDLSRESADAFPLAALLASRFHAEVLTVYVAHTPPVRRLWGVADAVEAAVPSDRIVSRFVEPWFGAVQLRATVEVGEPWEVIVGLAAAEHADLVVMATRGRDSLSDRVMGSQTERVFRHSPCPVLVTR